MSLGSSRTPPFTKRYIQTRQRLVVPALSASFCASSVNFRRQESSVALLPQIRANGSEMDEHVRLSARESNLQAPIRSTKKHSPTLIMSVRFGSVLNSLGAN